MKYFEDFEPGKIERIGQYQLSAEDIIAYSRKWAPQDFHCDPVAAGNSVFGGLTAAGIQLMNITVRQLVLHEPRVAIMAGLGWDDVRFLAPARPGDALSIFRECIDRRPSASAADRGIVKNRMTVENQKGQRLLRYVDIFLVAKRPPESRPVGS